ncbi:MAG: hypothetical protein JO240_01430, partial [Solirubrobacterales bacterium]|nr:hypothetical protein [Solirubrobacterales bacterium]
MTKRLAAVFLCGALAGCGTLQHDRSLLRAEVTADSNRAAAVADAHHLLALLVLPAGAIRSSTAPSPAMAHPGDGPPVTPDVVDLHAWWRVKGTLSSVVAFIGGHAPRGSSATGNGSSELHGALQMRFLELSWPPRSGVLGQRWLVVEVAPLSRGYTGVRADAQDIWVQPKAASERVPAQARVLTVSEAFPA